MSKSSGLEAEDSELRQRHTQTSSKADKHQGVSVEEGLVVPGNGPDDLSTKSPSKTYGRTPDGTGEPMMGIWHDCQPSAVSRQPYEEHQLRIGLTTSLFP